VQYTRHGNGWLIALIVAAILWLAALVAALSRDLSGVARNALAPISSRRLALAQAVPVIGLAVLQAASVVIALLLVHGSTASAVPLALMTLLASGTFSLLALALRLAFGRVGVMVFVLFLILQLAASSNVVPLETAPGILQRLNRVMPLTAFTNGASQLVSGGHVASFVGVVVVLAVWAAGAGALMVVVIRRGRADQLAVRKVRRNAIGVVPRT
jgi:putative membrane protein